MRISTALILLSLETTAAFVVRTSSMTRKAPLFGYLDDLSKELYAPDGNPDINADSKEETDMAKEQIDRYGPGDFSQFRVRTARSSSAPLTFTIDRTGL